MKRLATIAALLLLSVVGIAQQPLIQPTTAYIVTGPEMTALYHRESCPWVKRAGGAVSVLSLKDAKERYFRPHCLCITGREDVPPCDTTSTPTVAAAVPSQAAASAKPTVPPTRISLVGLTKSEVRAKLGQASLSHTDVWTYDRVSGGLQVYFENGIVSKTSPSGDVYILPVETGTGSKSGYYTNVDGDRVESPRKADAPPPGATARCGDGTYSFSTHRSGTCSHHGGVARWL
jgi:hypothetical protein